MQIVFLNGLWRFLKYRHLPVKLHSSASLPGSLELIEMSTFSCTLFPRHYNNPHLVPMPQSRNVENWCPVAVFNFSTVAIYRKHDEAQIL